MSEPLRGGTADDDVGGDSRRERFLGLLNWGWLGVGILTLVALPFYPDAARLLIAIIVTTLATFVSVRLLARHGYGRAACVLFCLLVDLGLFAIFLVIAGQIGLAPALATEVPALMMMGVAVLFAGALIEPRAPFVVAALNSGLLAIIVARADASDPRFSIHIFWWLLALTAWLYERTLHDAFARLAEGQRNLQRLVDERTAALRESVRRLSNAKSALEVSNRELDAFASAVSHDLRAPVRSIIGFSDALHDEHVGELSDPATAHLSRIRGAGRRMNTLIEDLLRLSKVTRPEMSWEEVDLSAVGRSVIEELRRTEPERRLEYRALERVTVYGDRRLLHVLFDNLIGNAWKFTRPKSHPWIELGATEIEGERVCFVRDNGVGFDMDYADKLFRPFQRLHSRKEFEGTGIGLATAQRIVHRHGGRIWAEGKKNEGAAFYVVFEGVPQGDGSLIESQ